MRYDELTDFEEINICNNPGAQITVLCTTFNHRNYITKALDGFVNQQIDVPFEILIYDDASDDGTSDVIREYAHQYPDLIKAFIAKQNTYNHPDRVAAKKEWRNRFVKGKYIAFCEGDDYWIDNTKLQRQWDALESHPECDLCACWGCTVTEDGQKQVSQIRPQQADGVINAENVILGGGQYFVSSGLFYRKQILTDEMPFQKVLSMDYVTQIRGALRGGAYYIDRKMAVYRRNSAGSWTERVLYNPEKLAKQWQIETRMLRTLDEDTDGKYHDVIVERLKSYNTFLVQLREHKSEIINIIQSNPGQIYMWGMGRRGMDFERFCVEENIHLSGVCDIANSNVGGISVYNNRIYSTVEVLKCADVLLASNSFAYEDLKKSDYKGVLVDLQEYMPYG